MLWVDWYKEIDLLWKWEEECIDNDKPEKAKAISKARDYMIIKKMAYNNELI